MSKQVIGAAIEVHRAFGPGLMESACEECLCRELELRGMAFQRQVAIPLEYKGVRLDCGFRIDILVGDLANVELKAVEVLKPVHELQLATYLKITGCWLGLLMNFNDVTIKAGLRRIVNG